MAGQADNGLVFVDSRDSEVSIHRLGHNTQNWTFHWTNNINKIGHKWPCNGNLDISSNQFMNPIPNWTWFFSKNRAYLVSFIILKAFTLFCLKSHHSHWIQIDVDLEYNFLTTFSQFCNHTTVRFHLKIMKMYLDCQVATSVQTAEDLNQKFDPRPAETSQPIGGEDGIMWCSNWPMGGRLMVTWQSAAQ